MVEKGKVNVGVVSSGGKQSIMAAFVLIYHEKTTRIIIFVYLRSSLSLRTNPKHFPNPDKSLKIIKEILFQTLNN